MVDDVDLRLTHSDCLQQDHVPARGVHQERGLQRRLAQATEGAPAGHRADEDPGIEEVIRQADPISKQRTLGEWGGGIDRQHADRAVAFALELCQGREQRRFSDPWRPGEADDRGLARVRVYLSY